MSLRKLFKKTIIFLNKLIQIHTMLFLWNLCDILICMLCSTIPKVFILLN